MADLRKRKSRSYYILTREQVNLIQNQSYDNKISIAKVADRIGIGRGTIHCAFRRVEENGTTLISEEIYFALKKNFPRIQACEIGDISNAKKRVRR